MPSYIVNSSESGAAYYGRIFEVIDDSDTTFTVEEYTKDGTMDLSGGVNGKYIDTQYIPKVGDWIHCLQQADKSTVYEIWSLNFKSGDVVDVYRGDQDTPIALSESDKSYVLDGVTSWKITEELPGIVESIIYTSIGISLGTDGNASSNIYNTFEAITSMNTETTLTDVDGVNVAGATVQCTTLPEANYVDQTGVPPDDGCAESLMRYGMWYAERGAQETCVIALKLPAGTYDVTFHSTDRQSPGTTWLNDFNFNGVDFSVDSDNLTTNCYTMTGVVYDGTSKDITLLLHNILVISIFNGLTIQRTA